MIRRESLRFFARHRTAARYCLTNLINLRTMTLNSDLYCTSFREFSQVGLRNGWCQIRRSVSVDFGSSYRINSSNGWKLKGCSNGCDDIFRKVDERYKKACALAPYRQLVRESVIGLEEEIGMKSWDGSRAFKCGNPLGFPNQPATEKLIVAVDVDEVLGSFLSALNKFIADRYFSHHSVSEYHVYEFFKIWNCSPAEAAIRVHEFFKTAYFKMGVHPIPGAHQALHKLSTFCNLSVVTSRQNAIKDHTIEWIEKHYPGLFQEIHFGNHFALDGQSRPKSEICRSLGAQVLIDDNPRYAIECAEAGIKVLLFDYDNSYPWCKTGSATQHPLVTKVHNWQEVEHQLIS